MLDAAELGSLREEVFEARVETGRVDGVPLL